MTRASWLGLALGATVTLAASACSWTEFDTLADETWVNETTKPSVNSSDWGDALVPAAFAGSGGEVVVIGADDPTFGAIEYNAGGGTNLGPGAVDLNNEFAITSIPTQPLLLSDPGTGTVALIIPTGDGRTIIYGGTDATAPIRIGQLIEGDPSPQGATFVGSGSDLSLVIAGKGMVGSATTDNFHIVPINTSTQTSCTATLVDGVTTLDAVALAAAPGLGSDGAVVAWNSDGTLVTYDLENALDNCGTNTGSASITATALAGTGSAWGSGSVNLGFAPVQAEIALIPGTGSGSSDLLAILAGHTDPDTTDMGELIVFDLTAGTIVGTPITDLDSLRGFALGDLGGTLYVALGFPLATAAATASAGQVQLYAVDPTSTSVVAGTATLTLNDDQPTSNELFGRSIAIVPFNDNSNGQQILVVGAENEIFSYYELNSSAGTQIYPNTRD